MTWITKMVAFEGQQRRSESPKRQKPTQTCETSQACLLERVLHPVWFTPEKLWFSICPPSLQRGGMCHTLLAPHLSHNRAPRPKHIKQGTPRRVALIFIKASIHLKAKREGCTPERAPFAWALRTCCDNRRHHHVHCLLVNVSRSARRQKAVWEKKGGGGTTKTL